MTYQLLTVSFQPSWLLTACFFFPQSRYCRRREWNTKLATHSHFRTTHKRSAKNSRENLPQSYDNLVLQSLFRPLHGNKRIPFQEWTPVQFCRRKVPRFSFRSLSQTTPGGHKLSWPKWTQAMKEESTGKWQAMKWPVLREPQCIGGHQLFHAY